MQKLSLCVVSLLACCLVAQQALAAVTWRQVFDEMCRVERAYKEDLASCKDGQIRDKLEEEYELKKETRRQLGAKLSVADCPTTKLGDGLPESMEVARSVELREILDEKCRLEAKYEWLCERHQDAYMCHRQLEAQKARTNICRRSKSLADCCPASALELGRSEAANE